MSRILLIIFSIFFATNLNGQTNTKLESSPFDFISNPSYSKSVSFSVDKNSLLINNINIENDQVLESIFSLKSNYEFQFRLWKRNLQSNFDDVFVMTLRNNEWTARFFEIIVSKLNRTEFIEKQVDQSKVNQLWERLLRNKVLELPDQSELQSKLVEFVPDTIGFFGSTNRVAITDCVVYAFELLSPEKKTFYNYRCPNAYLKKFGNVKELFDAVTMILLIEKFLGKPLFVD